MSACLVPLMSACLVPLMSACLVPLMSARRHQCRLSASSHGRMKRGSTDVEDNISGTGRDNINARDNRGSATAVPLMSARRHQCRLSASSHGRMKRGSTDVEDNICGTGPDNINARDNRGSATTVPLMSAWRHQCRLSLTSSERMKKGSTDVEDNISGTGLDNISGTGNG